jgi:hypothetical protein
MTRSPFRRLAQLAAGCALPLLVLFAPTASAVVLNISDDNCAQWVLSAPSGSPATQTLTCTSLSVPTCQIAGPSAAQTGTNATLTATCTPGPITSYTWTGASCTGSSCTVTAGTPGGVAYSVSAANSAGTGNAVQKTVTWSDTPVATAPSNCSLANSTTLSVGSFLALTPTCTGGDPVTQWKWTGPSDFNDLPATSSGAVSTLIQSTGTKIFTVQGSNAGGDGPVVSKSITIGGSTGGGGTGGGGDTGSGLPTISACTGFSQTKIIDATIPANGSTFVRYYVTTSGVFRNSSTTGLRGDEALVVAFRAPATVDPIFQVGITHTGDANGPQATRTFTLSSKPCDFAYPASTDAVWASQSTVMALKLATGSPSAYARYALVPGQVYFINMKSSAGAQQCTGRCDVYVSILNNTP